ncbi:MAG: phosphate starvation-inducible protein PhoH, partial [Clostridiales bacterium]|nr:phosphate starvation-inducible protein PhoH [Clostridiales bacterium]
MQTEIEKSIPIEHIRNIFGDFDRFVKKIERAFSVDITERNGAVKINGSQDACERAANVLDGLLKLSENNGQINEQQVDYIISLSLEGLGHEKDIAEIDKDIICRSI